MISSGGIMSINILILLCLFTSAYGNTIVEQYMKNRAAALVREADMLLGGDIILTDQERKVNDILMAYKRLEYKEGLDSNGAFSAAGRHFFHSKPLIDVSNVYKIIQILPKAVAAHMHSSTVGSSDFVALELTKRPNLYYCIAAEGNLLFRFFPSQPTAPCFQTKQWALVETLRSEASSRGYVDLWFKRSMSMYTDTPEIDYPDTNRAWKIFEAKIATIGSITNYEPVLREFYTKTLQGFYDDNVMYIEMRGVLSRVYKLDQTRVPPVEAVKIFKEVTDQFVASHPGFWGAKFIYSPHRFQPATEIEKRLAEAIEMKKLYPKFFVGFDLVGQEDIGNPLLVYIEQLLNAQSKNINYFFHSGETAWHGTKIDENLLDAVLLNTTRIAHGYGLASHPNLLQMARARGIGVEACPISNQVLKLVDDFRNHPAATSFIQKGFPLVVASDGPGIWNASPLSHDWYITFMAIGGQHADLRFLKQLALNSIRYSAMDKYEQAQALKRWQVSWDKFLVDVIAKFRQGKFTSPVYGYSSTSAYDIRELNENH